MNGKNAIRTVVAGVLLAAAACLPKATIACDPSLDWVPMSAAERAERAPVVIVGTTEELTYYNGVNNAAGDVAVQCIVAGGGNGGAAAVAAFDAGDEVVITGFGDSAACLATPVEGRSSIFFVDPHDDDGADEGLNGDFDARYDDIHSAVLPLSRQHIIDIALAIDSGGIGPVADCARALYGDDVFDGQTDDDGENGALTCTWHDGTTVPIGYSGKDAADCNDCSCDEFEGQGMVACTLMHCVGSGGATASASLALATLLAAAVAVAI